jgi:hypothetical protein
MIFSRTSTEDLRAAITWLLFFILWFSILRRLWAVLWPNRVISLLDELFFLLSTKFVVFGLHNAS